MPDDPVTAATIETINRYNDAFGRHDVDGIMALTAADSVFESTGPAPEGGRFEGRAAIRAVWEGFFGSSPQARFETEEMFATGDRCVVRWVYHWVDENGQPGHIRGVDLFRVREGQVLEKFAYVKG
ncbi:MAG: nuclear transport factor 2 family protein [Dehalococcoidia bacterium]